MKKDKIKSNAENSDIAEIPENSSAKKSAKQKANQAKETIKETVKTVNKKMPLVFYLTLFIFAVSCITAIILFVLYISLYEAGIIGEMNFVLAVVLLLIASIVISTSLVRGLGNRIIFHSIRKIIDASKAVAEGDFSLQIEIPREKETAAIVESFNDMVRKLGRNKMLSENFVSNVSHEFRTPLAAITGYAQLLEGDNISDEDRKEFAYIIKNKADLLSWLINNILELFNLENKSDHIQKENFRLDEQLRHVLLDFRPLWIKKNITVDVELEECIYCGNHELLREVWHNLIENAVKYTDENGKIEVSVKNSGGNAVVKIKDSGIGMDEESKKRIFDRFYRGTNTDTTVGNGLGMSIVKKIVSLHDSDIEFVSELGKGTEFTVTLKSPENVSDKHEENQAEQKNTKKKKKQAKNKK